MNDEETLIKLVKLYNRLSYFFRHADTKKSIDLGDGTIEHLQRELDRIYNEIEQEEQEIKENKKLKIIGK